MRVDGTIVEFLREQNFNLSLSLSWLSLSFYSQILSLFDYGHSQATHLISLICHSNHRREARMEWVGFDPTFVTFGLSVAQSVAKSSPFILHKVLLFEPKLCLSCLCYSNEY